MSNHKLTVSLLGLISLIYNKIGKISLLLGTREGGYLYRLFGGA